VFKVYGDCAFFGLTQDQAFWQRKISICGASGEVYTDEVNDAWHTYVYTYENTWGRTRLCGQVQSLPVLSNTFYVDDVKIYEGDLYDDVLGIHPTPSPTLDTDYEPTPTPESTPAPSDERIVYNEDFEDDSAECWPEFTIEYDPLDPNNMVGSMTETGWMTRLSDFLIKDVDPQQEYTMQFSVFGDVANVGISPAEQWERVTVSDGENTAPNIVSVDSELYDSLYERKLVNDWDTYVVKFSGKDKYRLVFQAQSSHGVNNGTFLVDDVKIYEGDCVEALKAALPQSSPNPDNDRIESPHDYPNDYDHTWTIHKEDATGVAVTFSEDTFVEEDYDFIIIYDGDDEEYATYTGDQLAGETIFIHGDTVKIRLTSDEDFGYYGFAVTNVEAFYDGETPDGWTPTPEPTPTPTILVNPTISPEEVAPGRKVELPENSLVTDGGFEKAKYDNDSNPLYTYVDAFTAEDDYGFSTKRFADYVQIKDDEDFAVEGEKCIIMQPFEMATIAVPNLYKYRGGELLFEYYVRVEDDTPFMTLGYFEDRSIVEETYEDEYGDEYKLYKQISSFTNMATNLDEDGEFTDDIDYINNWVKITEKMAIPDDLDEDNECVINFTSVGNAIYLDAVSCVAYDADGNEIRYVDGVLLDPTPKPTPTPTPTPTPVVTATPTVTPTATPTVTPTSTVEPTVRPTKNPVKKSVKFTKKSVKVKRGKKVTLRVKITGAKKAKFSVDKKGKKVVKLMKKKAKSVVVKGKKKGKATITAKVAGKKAKCKVTVR